jgi:hypothetical protein
MPRRDGPSRHMRLAMLYLLATPMKSLRNRFGRNQVAQAESFSLFVKSFSPKVFIHLI